MYSDILLDDSKINSSLTSSTSVDLDSLFENLSNDVENVNKFISNLSEQKKANSQSEQVIIEERIKLEKAKKEFSDYMEIQKAEIENERMKSENSLNFQKQNLNKAEAEFKVSMDNTLFELELAKKEIEIQREKLKQEKEQFETYKNLEINRIHHSEEILKSEKEQFEKYKEVNNRKIELENKNLEQKYNKFRDIINQFNSNFRPIIEEE